jgi:hypothetical protein
MSKAAPQRERSEVQNEKQEVPHPRYEPTGEIEAKSGSDVVDPWIRGKYPITDAEGTEDGVIRTSVNFYAKQHDDGSGVFMSPRGSAVYAIRTRDGTVLGNESRGLMWPWGAESEEEVEEYENIPFRFVGQVVTEQSDLHTVDEGSALGRGLDDGETMVEGNDFMQEVVDADILNDDHDEQGVLLTHESSLQVYIGWDSTAYPNNDLFGFVPFDGENGTPVPSAEDALDLLKPYEAAAREDHDVKRQGEWFLVRTGEEPEGTIQKPGVSSRPYGGSPMESHVPRDWATGVPDDVFLERVESHDEVDREFDSPQDVFNWVEEHRIPDTTEEWIPADEAPWNDEIGDLTHLFEELRELADGIFVRGSFRHRDNEHYMEKVEDWHRAETHEWEVITTDGRRIMAD